MRLPELCLAVLCAATARTGSPEAAREKSPGPGAAAESGRGAPGEAALRAGGVDPRQAWMLLAGSPGQASGSRARGRTGTVRHGTGVGTAPVPASGQSPGKSPQVALQVRVPGNGPAPYEVATALEKLLRELQLLLKGTQRAPGIAAGKEGEGDPRAGAGNSGDQAPPHPQQRRGWVAEPGAGLSWCQEKLRSLPKDKPCSGFGVRQVKGQETHRKSSEGHEEEKESSGGHPQARSHCHVEAAFHCWTCENITVEQRAWKELRLFYIPEREGTFHRGLGLNLTSGQYMAPIAGYYTFTAMLHTVRRDQQRKRQPCRRNHLRVLICVQSHCQHNSNFKTTYQLENGSDLFTLSITGVLCLQAGQYASVLVHNTAGSPRTVQSVSDFSAILLGV